MTAISVCLVGKESVFKEGIKSLLHRNDFRITADHEDIAVVPPDAAETQEAQLVVGIDEENENLPQSVQKLKEKYKQSRIVVISGNVETSVIVSAFDAGVDGLILKDISCNGLIGSLKLAVAGEKVYPASMLMQPANTNAATPRGNADSSFNLSRQELKIIHCLANGEPNKIIAHHLDITEATVKVHVRTILRKLGTTNRTKAAIFAISKGLAPAPKQLEAQAR